MNIPAKEIVRQLEQELELLKQAISRGQADLVKEKVVAIESYCKILKGANTQTARPVQPTPTVQPQPVMPQTHIATPISVEPSSSPSQKSNLLDF